MSKEEAAAVKYRVLYAITREKYYEVEAANAENAMEKAFMEGEHVETGQTLNVTDCDTVLVTDEVKTSRPQTKRPRWWNGKRAGWARIALDTFRADTGTDEEDALCDLLCDLMHLADFEGWDFENEHRRALTHYEAEQTEL